MICIKGNSNIYLPHQQTLTELQAKRVSIGFWIMEILDEDNLLMLNGLDQALN